VGNPPVLRRLPPRGRPEACSRPCAGVANRIKRRVILSAVCGCIVRCVLVAGRSCNGPHIRGCFLSPYSLRWPSHDQRRAVLDVVKARWPHRRRRFSSASRLQGLSTFGRNLETSGTIIRRLEISRASATIREAASIWRQPRPPIFAHIAQWGVSYGWQANPLRLRQSSNTRGPF
jgi:hypothetical protein